MGKLPDRPFQVGYFGVVRDGVQWLEQRIVKRGVIYTTGYIIAPPKALEVEAKRAELAQELGVSEASPAEDKLALERVVVEELATEKAAPVEDVLKRERQHRDSLKVVATEPAELADVLPAKRVAIRER